MACILQEALGVLFHKSILDDLMSVSANASANATTVAQEAGSSKKKRNSLTQVQPRDITAKMVYKAVDNSHSHVFEEKEDDATATANINTAHTTAVAAADTVPQGGVLVLPENGHGLNSNTNEMQPPKIPGLVPTLRKYQAAAVQWMLQRERGEYKDCGWEICWVVFLNAGSGSGSGSNQSLDGGVLPLYEYRRTKGSGSGNEGSSCDSSCMYYNPFSGWLVDTYEAAKMSTVGNDDSVRGGILAESMGLGTCSVDYFIADWLCFVDLY